MSNIVDSIFGLISETNEKISYMIKQLNDLPKNGKVEFIEYLNNQRVLFELDSKVRELSSICNSMEEIRKCVGLTNSAYKQGIIDKLKEIEDPEFTKEDIKETDTEIEVITDDV